MRKKILTRENMLKWRKDEGYSVSFQFHETSNHYYGDYIPKSKPCESIDNPCVINERTHPHLTDEEWNYLYDRKQRLLEIINEELPTFVLEMGLVDNCIENFLEEMEDEETDEEMITHLPKMFSR